MSRTHQPRPLGRLVSSEWLAQGPFQIAGQINTTQASTHSQQVCPPWAQSNAICDVRWEDVQLAEVCSHTLSATVAVTLEWVGGGMQH